ncbi:hypothetical protein PsorP6_006313 [Peronosclerospora sorghi]|uniref:Uncharacterized protein n=1 Tax=Peronosclerospora sorghi TaxID=230839 RepID=A0ACC0W6T2_9STRA|nr:hypothetical protein PsorP6_006313 [Peronosclerospora sorghi]
MTESRANFVTEFLLRELLSALGTSLPSTDEDAAHGDSFSESLGESTGSQSALGSTLASPSRVMLVRRTNSSQQTVTLVDREYDIEAYIPSHVIVDLQHKKGYQTLGRLRGSVVRVIKYHFSTMAQCVATEQQNRPMSVCLPSITKNKARVYLYVDALAIVDDNQLAIKLLPAVYNHPLVEKRLQAMSDAELDKQLMIHQGVLPPAESTARDTCDDEPPLMEEDYVILEEQEQQLEEQDEWERSMTMEQEITDSELIEENGSVPMSEFQVVREPTSPEKSIMSINSSMVSSETLSEAVSEHLTGISSPRRGTFQFQQEDIRETFMAISDVEPSDTEDEIESQDVKKSTPRQLKLLDNGKRHSVVHFSHCSPTPASPTKTQSSETILDLTDDQTMKAATATSLSSTETASENESKRDASDPQKTEYENAAPRSSSQKPPKGVYPIEKPAASVGWASSLLRLVSLYASSADTSSTTAQSSGGKADDIDQSFSRAEQEEKETNSVLSEDLGSSEATLIPQYDDDRDDGDHAFEYEGMMSDVTVSSQLRTPNEEHSLGTKEAQAEDTREPAVTPHKLHATKGDTISSLDLEEKERSTSAQAATPGTENCVEAVDQHTPTVLSCSEGEEQMASTTPNSSLPMHSQVKSTSFSSPSKLTISVGSGSSSNRKSCTEFPIPNSRPCKQKYRVENLELNLVHSHTIQRESSMSHSRRNDDQCRYNSHKRCRRNIITNQGLHEANSNAPQFEHQSNVLRRPSVVEPRISLKELCRSLGSRERDQGNAKDRARSSTQVCREWKKYEHLFPPLDMTRIKRMIAKSKERDT